MKKAKRDKALKALRKAQKQLEKQRQQVEAASAVVDQAIEETIEVLEQDEDEGGGATE